MAKLLTVAEAGRIGGINRWSKISKKARSKAMKLLAMKRWRRRKD